MTIYPEALRGHLGRPVATVCRCWRLRRVDGEELGFTDHDLPLTVDGLLCEPQAGLNSSEARRSLGLAAEAVDVEGALSSPRIGAEDIESGAFDGATVETFLVNWRAPEQFARIGRAMVGKITVSDGRFVAELESPLRFLDQPNGSYIMRRCDAELGDARCGLTGLPEGAGCEKSFAACKAYGNTVNFRGFPHLPGNDHAYAIAKRDGVFDGKAVVP